MYQPLLDPEPLPPGPRVTNPAAPLLRLLVRIFNVVLAAAALLLIGAALWMDEQYQAGGTTPAGPPGAAVWMGERYRPFTYGGGGDGGPGALPATGLAAVAAKAVATFPWFIYFVGGFGAYCFVTALCGLTGVKRDRRLHLWAHVVLLALLIVGEAVATLLLLTDNAWRARIPDDPSGRWREAQQWLEGNPRAARLAAVGLLGAELAALAAALALQSIYQAALDAWLDDREEATARARQVLNHAVRETYAGGSGSSSSGRWRKYQLNPSALEASRQEALATAALMGSAEP